MCIACELGFWDMVQALPPETRERILREEVARMACDAPDDAAAPPSTQNERKPSDLP
jgi:hypothetical protein